MRGECPTSKVSLIVCALVGPLELYIAVLNVTETEY